MNTKHVPAENLEPGQVALFKGRDWKSYRTIIQCEKAEVVKNVIMEFATGDLSRITFQSTKDRSYERTIQVPPTTIFDIIEGDENA